MIVIAQPNLQTAMEYYSHQLSIQLTFMKMLITIKLPTVHSIQYCQMSNYQEQEQPEQQTFCINIRNQQSTAIRKQNRQQIFWKRRLLSFNQSQEHDIQQHRNQNNANSKPIIIMDDRYSTEIEIFINSHYQIQMLPSLIQNLKCQDIILNHKAIIGMRKLMSSQEKLIIKQLIVSGIVQYLFELVKQTQYPQMVQESLWILTNIAAGNHKSCKYLVDRGAIHLFQQFLKSDCLPYVITCLCGLGNIACDQEQYRLKIIDDSVIDTIIDNMARFSEVNHVEQSCWALSVLCRGNNPAYQKISRALQIICLTMQSNLIENEQILIDCCWALCQSQALNLQYQNMIIKSNMIKTLLPLAQKSSNYRLLLSSLRLLGNIAAGSQQNVDYLLDNGLLDIILKCIRSEQKLMRRQSCWVLSNITAGGDTQVMAFAKRQDIVQQVVQIFMTDTEQNGREAMLVFSNMIYFPNLINLGCFYIDNGIIQCFVNYLQNAKTSIKFIIAALQSLKKIMIYFGDRKLPSENNIIALQLQKYKGTTVLQQLQYSQSDKVYKQVSQILTRFFIVEQQQLMEINSVPTPP